METQYSNMYIVQVSNMSNMYIVQVSNMSNMYIVHYIIVFFYIAHSRT